MPKADGELRPVIAVGKNNHAIIINRQGDLPGVDSSPGETGERLENDGMIEHCSTL